MTVRWLAVGVLALAAFAAAAHGQSFLRGGAVSGAAPPPTLTGILLSNNTFSCGSAGTVGAITVNGTGSIGAATLSLSGTDAAQFSLSSTTVPSNLTVGASPTGCPRTYSVTVTATLAGATGSPFPQAFTITGGGPQTIASISPSSCSFVAGTANGAICTLSVTMSPPSPAFTGTITLSGANTGGFHCATTGTTCNLQQSSSGTAAGTYADVTANATQSGISNSPKTQALTLTGTTAGSVVATADYFVPTTGTTPPGSKVPYTVGQVFRSGDVPSGYYVSVSDGSGNPLPYQMDSVSPPWGDGSLRHAVFKVDVAATTGNTQGRLQFVLQSGTYNPASTPRAITEITSHNYLVHFKNVKTHPGNTAPYAWTAKGSGNFTCTINTQISASQYELRGNGPVEMLAHVYGFMVDDSSSAADPHLFCDTWIDVYSDPSNSASVMYREIMSRISQPIANPSDGGTGVGTVDANADVVIGQASLYDGATKMRDYSDDAITMTPANVNASSGYFNTPTSTGVTPAGAMQGSVPLLVHLVSGALPAGLSEGNIAFTQPFNSGANFYLQQHNKTQIGSIPLWTPTTAGSGSFQLIPLQFAAYYNGFFITADIQGSPVLQAGTWTPPAAWFVQPNLDGTTNDHSTSSQKAYWESTGLLPGWDISFGASTGGTLNFGWNWSQGGPYYIPGTNGPMRVSIDGTGADYDTDSPFAEWYVRHFVRMGATNFSPSEYRLSWVAGLATATLPQTIMKRAPVSSAPPRIIPFDNGPDNAGGSYPGLGASSCKNDLWRENSGAPVASNACFVAPASIAGGAYPWWHDGVWASSFSNYHWPPTAYYEYLVFGKDYFLDALRGSTSRVILQLAQLFAAGPIVTLNSKTFYRAMYVDSSAAQATVDAMPFQSGYFGNAADPEIAYFQHIGATNQAYAIEYYTNHIDTASRDAGNTLDYTLAGATFNGITTFQSGYATQAHVMANAITRAHGLDYAVKTASTAFAGMFDAPGTPATTTGVGTWGIAVSAGGTYWYAPGYSGWTYPCSGTFPDPRKYYGTLQTGGPGGSPWGMFVNSAGLWTAQPGLSQYFANGDEIYIIHSGTCGSPSPDAPANLVPPAQPQFTTYYVINFNSSAGTFNVSLTPGGAAITGMGTGAWNSATWNDWWLYRAKHDQGSMFFDANHAYDLLIKASMAETLRVGVAPWTTYGPSLTQSYAVMDARDPASAITGFQENNCQPGGDCFNRLSMNPSIPVVPALTGP